MAEEIEICIDHLEELLEQYKPFIIRTVSGVTGRYVAVEHDDTYSIALSAFAEAVNRFDEERGNFMSFVGLVIRSRLQDYLREETRHSGAVSLEAMSESGQEIPAPEGETGELQEEIRLYQQELAKFGLDLETLADHSPQHRDTRERAVSAAERSSQDAGIVAQTYEKKKLPIRPVARLCGISEKIVKTSRIFILGTMLVFVRKLGALTRWIRGTR